MRSPIRPGHRVTWVRPVVVNVPTVDAVAHISVSIAPVLANRGKHSCRYAMPQLLREDDFQGRGDMLSI